MKRNVKLDCLLWTLLVVQREIRELTPLLQCERLHFVMVIQVSKSTLIASPEIHAHLVAGPGGQLQPVLMGHPPQLSVKTWGGGAVGGGSSRGGGGVKPGVGGGPAGGWGGGLAGGQGRRPARGGGGLGLGLGLGSPSWWNQSWFITLFSV